MEKTDGRHLSDLTLEHLRRQAVVLHRQGKTRIQIAEAFGVNRVTVGIWLNKYKTHGKKAFKNQACGRKFGTKRSLTLKQENELQKIIQTKTPDQLKMPFALWDRKAIKELIHDHYGINMPIRTVGEYLSRWGFTPQRPLKRAYEQRPEEVRKWLNEQYPDIVTRAKLEKAEIHWGDETGINNTNN